MSRAEHIQTLLEEYAQQRARNEQALLRRIAEAEERDPRIGELRRESAEEALRTMREILTLSTREEREAAAGRMRGRGQVNNAEIRSRLKALGLPEDHLSLRYRCPVCRDTGYVGDAPSRFCDCFETRLRALEHEDGSMGGMGEETFETFRLDFIPEEDGQRERMDNARKICENYADSLPDAPTQNLLLMGAGGLGKTFLLNCVYSRAVDRGIPAVRITAFRLFEAMRRQHMGGDGEEAGFPELLDVPLLLIDDLGTEPMMRNITVEYLFTLLNERMASRRHTVICTNLTPVMAQERYGERVTSRLFDRQRTTLIRLTGKDLRRQ